jgi:hypothetical protein
MSHDLSAAVKELHHIIEMTKRLGEDTPEKIEAIIYTQLWFGGSFRANSYPRT